MGAWRDYEPPRWVLPDLGDWALLSDMKLIVAAIFSIFPGVALAGTCGPDRDTDIALFEQAKAAFLASDYREFVRIAGPFFPNLDADYDQYFSQLERAIPDGFDRCETILQRREMPGFHQELIFFFPIGSPSPMALHLIAAEVNGEIRLVEFTYNTSLSGVMDELK